MADPYAPNPNDPYGAQQAYLAQQYAMQLAALQNMPSISQDLQDYLSRAHQGGGGSFDPSYFSSYLQNPGNPTEEALTRDYYNSILAQSSGGGGSGQGSLLDAAQNQAAAYAQMKAEYEFTQQMAAIEDQRRKDRQDLLFKLQDALSQEMAQGTTRATAYGQVASVLAAARAGGIDVPDSDAMAILNALYPPEGGQGASSLAPAATTDPLSGPVLSATWAGTYGTPGFDTSKGLTSDVMGGVITKLLADPNVAAQVMTPTGGGVAGLKARVQMAYNQFKTATGNTAVTPTKSGGGLTSPVGAAEVGLGLTAAGLARMGLAKATGREAPGWARATTFPLRAAVKGGAWAGGKAATGASAGADWLRTFGAPITSGNMLPNEWLTQAEPSAAEGYRGVGTDILRQQLFNRAAAASAETGMPISEAAGFAGQVRPMGMGSSPTYTEGIPSLGVLRALVYGMGEPGAMQLPTAPLPRIAGTGMPVSGEIAPAIPGEMAGLGLGALGMGTFGGGSPLFGLLGGHIYTEK